MVSLVRLLAQAGHDVHVIPTEAALRFVGLPTWEAISHHPVSTTVFEDVAEVRHVAEGQQADLIVVAPATAHTLAKLAHGLSDDLLGTTVLASTAPVLLAPAMHTEMWHNSATQANVELLRERGYALIGPEHGALTGSDSGIGRMSEPDQIAAKVAELLHPQDWAGARVLISAGGTHEPLDPVRFLGNHSSGRQGIALATAAAARGAEVTLVLGTAQLTPPAHIRVIRAETAAEMRTAMLREASQADVIVMAAAVADYRPVNPAGNKLHKADTGERFSLELVANPDVLAELVAARRPGQVIVGFAAETAADDDELLALGWAKRARKQCDVLVLNRVGTDPESGVERVFGQSDTAVWMLMADGTTVHDAQGDKLSVAHAILDVIRR